MKCKPREDRRKTRRYTIALKTDSEDLKLFHTLSMLHDRDSRMALMDEVMQLGVKDFVRKQKNEHSKRIYEEYLAKKSR